MEQRNWSNYGDILTVEDVKTILGIGTKSARKLIKENGGLLIAGKLLIGKAKIQAMFE